MIHGTMKVRTWYIEYGNVVQRIGKHGISSIKTWYIEYKESFILPILASVFKDFL